MAKTLDWNNYRQFISTTEIFQSLLIKMGRITYGGRIGDNLWSIQIYTDAFQNYGFGKRKIRYKRFYHPDFYPAAVGDPAYLDQKLNLDTASFLPNAFQKISVALWLNISERECRT